jgi:hypothetical protein
MALVKLNISGHENKFLAEQGFVFVGPLHVDLADPLLGEKVVSFLSEYVTSEDLVEVCLPGLAALSYYVVVALHGLTGQFPRLVAMVRTPDGEFIPAPPVDMQELRNATARANRRNVVKL